MAGERPTARRRGIARARRRGLRRARGRGFRGTGRRRLRVGGRRRRGDRLGLHLVFRRLPRGSGLGGADAGCRTRRSRGPARHRRIRLRCLRPRDDDLRLDHQRILQDLGQVPIGGTDAQVGIRRHQADQQPGTATSIAPTHTRSVRGPGRRTRYAHANANPRPAVMNSAFARSASPPVHAQILPGSRACLPGRMRVRATTPTARLIPCRRGTRPRNPELTAR